jgi:DNA repair exonuclease SbcCD ATPase subunit
MWQLLGGLCIVLAAGGYWLFQQNEALKAENAARKLAFEQQVAAFETLQKESQKQQQAMLDMSKKSQEIQNEMNQYMDIFKRHSLPKLAAAKPGMIEKRANDATKAIFDAIEADSRDIDGLDNGVQLTGTTGVAAPVEEAPAGSDNSNKASAGGDTPADNAKGD